jgi:glycosyltransferase involved in cell wall biosynthesis
MKILMVNKFYYVRGGAERYMFEWSKTLQDRGHQIIPFSMQHELNDATDYSKYFVSSVDFDLPGGIVAMIQAFARTVYSLEAKSKVEDLVRSERPDIAHLHNFTHQISPSILDVFRKYNIPSVMTLHDYKLVCPSYTMLFNGRPCERCKGSKFYWCALKKCTKGSYLKSAANALGAYAHGTVLRAYDQVRTFVCPSKFLMDKMKEMGLRAELVHVPYAIDASLYRPYHEHDSRTIVYFGRLSSEKGLITLLEAAKGLNSINLKIIGEGPEKGQILKRVRKESLDNVSILGYKAGEDLFDHVRHSMFAVVPSEWYENYPRAAIEAFALGKPVLGARIGGIPELVKDWETGLTFEPGNVQDLTYKIEALCEERSRLSEMGRRARQFVQKELNSRKHYEVLMEIYRNAGGKTRGQQNIG